VPRALRRPSPPQLAFAGLFAVTLLGLLSIGATLPVLPRYVHGELGGGDVEVGIVTGAFAITGLACRPLAGQFADRRGRKLVVVLGALLTAAAGLLYFVPAGVPGLIFARLFLGAGEGMVYTAGSAWVIDLSPPDRRARLIGLYGLAIWGGLTLGPPIGELLLRASSFEVVWAFAAAAPLLGALIATRIPEAFRPGEDAEFERRLISPEALRPGLGLSLTIVGYAAVAAFIVLHLDERGIGHGAEVFTAFAATVVATRIVGGGLPDRIGPLRCAAAAGIIEAAGLIAIGAAHSLGVAIAGAVAMGAGFSILFPSLALVVVNRVPEERRGVAMGTFTAFFDLGMGVGGPLAGAAAAIGGYEAAFFLAALCALGTVAVAASLRTATPAPLAVPRNLPYSG
jgi:MFS family permease